MEPLFDSWFVDSMIGESRSSRVYRLRREGEAGLEYAALKTVRIPAGQDDIANALSTGKYPSVKAFVDAYAAAAKAEAQLLISLRDNPNILSVYNYAVVPGENESGCFFMLLTELLSPLSEGINAEDADEQTVVRLGIDICNALEAIADAGTYHGEIKPENIFVDANGCFKLGDFGFGREFTSASRVGDSWYVAPEVYAGETAAPTADIYSLGILMYKFLNHNRAPFLPEFPQQISFADREIAFEKKIRGEAMPEPDSANERLASVILKACAYNPSGRYSAASGFAYDLELAMNGKAFNLNDTAYSGYTAVQPIIPVGGQPKNYSDNQDTMIIPEGVKENSFTPLSQAVETGRGTTLGAYESEVRFDTQAAPGLPQELPEEPESPQEVPEQKRINGVALAIIVLLCLLIVAGVIWIVKGALSSRSPDETTSTATTSQVAAEKIKVANFINSQYTVITENPIYTDNFSFKAKHVYDSADEGLVIAQSIDAGTEVEKGAAIELTVSKGPEKITLINVTGKSYSEAYVLLTQAGFIVTRTEVDNDNVHEADTVKEMSLSLTERYDKGTAVVLTVWGEPPTTTEPTTVTTEAPTTASTEPSTEPSTTSEHTTDRESDSNGLQYYAIMSPVVSYTISDSSLSSVTVAFNRNIGPNPVSNGAAKIRVYLNNTMIQSLDADIICFTDDENGNGLICTLTIDDENFEFNTDMYSYAVSFPEGVITSDTGTNYGFTAEIA